MELIKLFLPALIILTLAILLTYTLGASAQTEACTVQGGVTVCEIDGRLCIKNDDGTIGPCRINPPTPSSPIAGGVVWRVYLPVVEK